MKNKKLIIGLGILAVAGIGYYIWQKKNKDSFSKFEGEESSNATGRKTKLCCVKETNGVCNELKEVYYTVPCPNPKRGASARTIPMPSTGVCPKGYMKGANDAYCRPIPSGGR